MRLDDFEPQDRLILFIAGMTLLGLGGPILMTGYYGPCVAAARKRSHQWRVSLTPNNTKTIGRMTCHCFLRPIRVILGLGCQPLTAFRTQHKMVFVILAYLKNGTLAKT